MIMTLEIIGLLGRVYTGNSHGEMELPSMIPKMIHF